MALTPEDILNKQFQSTQFRKGYDEREVDDFLDEIVAEMRSLIAQRDDYLQQLNDCRAGRGLPAAAAAPAVGEGELDAASSRLAELQDQIRSAEDQLSTVSARVSEAETEAEQRVAAAAERAQNAERDAEQRSTSAVATAASSATSSPTCCARPSSGRTTR